ncbi:hypothetical protein I4U23_004316 [Adineta vaga]|nr:hypothetical protein I4U23_004316 [Adineta vaga]
MSASQPRKSLRAQQADKDVNTQREKYMNEIKTDHEEFGDFQMSKSVQRNVMLVGRTRTGKSTIKSMLVNSMVVAEEQKLMVGTKFPQFETFHVAVGKKISTDESSEDVPKDDSSEEEDVSTNNSSEKDISTTESPEDIVLNIIDTPGLFERGTDEITPRDNDIIMQAIEACVNQEITKFHVICFCVAITVGINEQDIQALKLMLKMMGDKIASNSCLIITHCESKDKKQRKSIISQLKEDKEFKLIRPFFKMGIFFSGVLNRDDYKCGSENLIGQYLTVSKYRAKLIKMFSKTVKPFPLIDTLISDSKRACDNQKSTALELEQTEMKLRHANEDLKDIKNCLQEKEKELNETQNKLKITDAEFETTKKELKKKETDLEEMQAQLEDTKSAETGLQSIIADLQVKCNMDERQKKELEAKLEWEEKQRREAEKARETEARNRLIAEVKLEADAKLRREEKAKEHEKYTREVEARQEKARLQKEAQREQEIAQQRLKEEQKEKCSIS